MSVTSSSNPTLWRPGPVLARCRSRVLGGTWHRPVCQGGVLSDSRPLARSDIEPFFGLATGTVGGFPSAGGCPALLCGDFLAPSGHSHGVLFGQLRALGKRLGSPAQG
jgi:hypothetical protein